MRASFIVAVALALLAGCKTIEYGPLDGEAQPVYGYREIQTAAGKYRLTVVGVPGARPDAVHSSWDRRARELCGGTQFTKTIFRAERPAVPYGYDGANPGAMWLEGFLECGAGAGASIAGTPD